jgi:hypothetical protein
LSNRYKLKLPGSIIILLFSSFIAASQGLNNLWLYGYNYGGIDGLIDYISGSPIITTTQLPMYFNAEESVISDRNGNVLFYSNGNYIADRTNDTMLNGSGLTPGWFADSYGSAGFPISQGSIILPTPGQINKYYLFHVTGENLSTSIQALNIFCTTVDMSLNNGLGGVISKNIPLFYDTLIIGEITAVKHANGRDWWLLSHRHNTNWFHLLLVAKDGISGPFDQDIGGVNTFGSDGQNVFSPDGHKYARYLYRDGLDIMDFDRCSGTFSNDIHITINDSADASGVAFSPNSRFLYVGSERYVYQYDMHAANIEASRVTVAVWDSFYSPNPPFAITFFKGMLAGDGKIYFISPNGSDYLHVVNFPDSLGIACDFQQHSLYLQTYNAFSMPNYPNYFLGAETGSICDSLVVLEEVNKTEPILTIYPNPVLNRRVIFSYPIFSKFGNLVINDIEGKEVCRFILSAWSSTHNITLPQLNSGVYIARIEGTNANVKFILE